MVYPSVVITYLGQAAYLWDHAEDVNNTFYASIPDPVYWPMFVIATLAAIVASQVIVPPTLRSLQLVPGSDLVRGYGDHIVGIFVCQYLRGVLS